MSNRLEKIYRAEPERIDRSKYLRLDKNERIIPFEKIFLHFLKNKINSYNLSAYPNIIRIKKIIAKKINVNYKMIYLSAGSDLALKTCFELFTKNKSKVIILEPTFGMVNVYCKIYNLKSIKIGYGKNLNLNYKKLFRSLTKKISLVVLANPNSPTGTIIPEKIMVEIINKSNKLRVPMVIDEAYEGFFADSYKKYIKKNKYLIITRSFSKSFGLAGLRAGFAISNQKIIELMNKFRPMYEINSISCLAIEFLYKNYSIVKKHIKEVNAAKNFLIKKLKKLKINFIKTHANFMHIELGKNSEFLEKKFKSNGILFRKGPGVKGFESFSRFSIGSKNQMQNVLNIIKNVDRRDL